MALYDSAFYMFFRKHTLSHPFTAKAGNPKS